jgi:dTDP-4-amino-4,6-dideoxygalactose transaminase
MYLGARPVFIDCAPDTWTIDVALLERYLERSAADGRRVKAVVPVDLFGQCCDYDALLKVCEAYDVRVVEDSAEALGSTYRGRPAGTFGDAAILSFNGNKILSTGGGGMLVTDDDAIADRARYLATQAREPVPYYEHKAVGYNYRMNNLLAAIGRAQLAHLPDRVSARRSNFERYSQAFADVRGITMMPQASYGVSNCWLTCVTIDPDEFGATGEEVRLHLAGLGIESRATWKPMHMQPVFEGFATIGGDVCADLYARGLCLPSGSNLTPAQHEQVVEAVLTVPARLATSTH